MLIVRVSDLESILFDINVATSALSCCHNQGASYSILSSISSVQLLSRGQLFVTPWTAVQQASLSFTNSWSLLKLMSIESVMPCNHLILCRPLQQYTVLICSFPDLEPVCCSMFSSNCCFLTCIQISQEAGKVVWYSYLRIFHSLLWSTQSKTLA